ncbi:MAG: hypothetical protein PHT96_05845 [Syntrophorhabdaceae bacterium]|nr:hypothetical protein [Syntrophorhabdaceae bacterium]MDD4195920.1 hypothetical protein [Syntrophorhabdaceae bacterium]HOC45618.1 hypothetical protein [Syntrophorhabdaceae bacterium]
MAGRRHPNAYVDYDILDLATRGSTVDKVLDTERQAIASLWQLFEKEKLSLVTSVDEMELDFVIHMNRGGLCVTDTFQITDNIDTFERWSESDRIDTAHWRAIVDLYDRLDTISGHDAMVGEHSHPRIYEHVTSVMRNGPKTPVDHSGPFGGFDEETAILRDCAATLHTVYDMKVWADMKHIQYDLNWLVLKGVLSKYDHPAVLTGSEGDLCKYLLGLVNRLVNIGKKSCPRLPLEERHIGFILDIVRKKYCQENIERHISHIVHALLNNVDYHLTIDGELANKFAERKVKLENLLGEGPIRMEVILPSELIKKLGP